MGEAEKTSVGNRAEVLTSLLDTITLNRHALAIVRALDAGDQKKVSENVGEANKAKIDPIRVKNACKSIRSDQRSGQKR